MAKSIIKYLKNNDKKAVVVDGQTGLDQGRNSEIRRFTKRFIDRYRDALEALAKQ